jgi:hypothetical protein
VFATTSSRAPRKFVKVLVPFLLSRNRFDPVSPST